MHLENMCPAERSLSSDTCMWMFTVMSGLKNRIYILNKKKDFFSSVIEPVSGEALFNA